MNRNKSLDVLKQFRQKVPSKGPQKRGPWQKNPKSVHDLKRMLGHETDWPEKHDRDDVKWRYEKSRVYHKEFDPDFDNQKMRVIYRKVLKIKVPIHAESNHYDRKFAVKCPVDKNIEIERRKDAKERKPTGLDLWIKQNTTSLEDLLIQ